MRFSVAAEERVLSRVLNRVGEPGQKEDAEMMGRFTGRKILVAAAAICMGAAFVAVAGGKVVDGGQLRAHGSAHLPLGGGGDSGDGPGIHPQGGGRLRKWL